MLVNMDLIIYIIQIAIIIKIVVVVVLLLLILCIYIIITKNIPNYHIYIYIYISLYIPYIYRLYIPLYIHISITAISLLLLLSSLHFFHYFLLSYSLTLPTLHLTLLISFSPSISPLKFSIPRYITPPPSPHPNSLHPLAVTLCTSPLAPSLTLTPPHPLVITLRTSPLAPNVCPLLRVYGCWSVWVLHRCE